MLEACPHDCMKLCGDIQTQTMRVSMSKYLFSLMVKDNSNSTCHLLQLHFPNLSTHQLHPVVHQIQISMPQSLEGLNLQVTIEPRNSPGHNFKGRLNINDVESFAKNSQETVEAWTQWFAPNIRHIWVCHQNNGTSGHVQSILHWIGTKEGTGLLSAPSVVWFPFFPPPSCPPFLYCFSLTWALLSLPQRSSPLSQTHHSCPRSACCRHNQCWRQFLVQNKATSVKAALNSISVFS